MEEEEPNLGKLIDQKLEQVYWDRTEDHEVKQLTLIFKEHTLTVVPAQTRNGFILEVRLVEQ